MLGGLFDPRLDLYPLLAAVLAAVTCGVLGNFLVLRRISLMGDAISHSVLPGLVVAFLITTDRSAGVMLVGAAVAGLLTVVLIEVVKRYGRVEPGAAMGVVFSVLFALGVLLIERAAVRHVDLDADCVLYGQLETLALRDEVPRQVWLLLGMCVGAFAFVGVLFKELRIAAFDPALATTQGFHAVGLHYLLMVLVAGATVASFEAVGSILVIAMLVCPAATARLLTDRLWTQVAASVAAALVSAVVGYFGATVVPGRFGLDSVNAAGSITVVSGGLLVVAIVTSPSHGVVAKWVRRRGLVRRVVRDDVLATMFRREERGKPALTMAQVDAMFEGLGARDAAGWLCKRGSIMLDGDRITLTEEGRARALEIVRRHRLWERYLVDEAGMPADHVHETAELLEHLSVRPVSGPSEDPHGRAIP